MKNCHGLKETKETENKYKYNEEAMLLASLTLRSDKQFGAAGE